MKSGVHITPEMVEAAYELLRRTPPFSRWRLPHPEEVDFVVDRRCCAAGEHFFSPDAQRHRIHVSAALHSFPSSILVTVAHEMVHLYLVGRGVRAVHGADFRRCAARVCRRHGWDPAQF